MALVSIDVLMAKRLAIGRRGDQNTVIGLGRRPGL
jgi:hypothetical protein